MKKDLYCPQETNRAALRPGWSSILCRHELSLPKLFHISALLRSLCRLLVAAHFRFETLMHAFKNSKIYWTSPIQSAITYQIPLCTTLPSNHKQEPQSTGLTIPRDTTLIKTLSLSWNTDGKMNFLWLSEQLSHWKTILFTKKFTKWALTPHNQFIFKYFCCCTNSYISSDVTGFTLYS